MEYPPKSEDGDKIVEKKLSVEEGHSGGITEEKAGVDSRSFTETKVEVDEKVKKIKESTEKLYDNKTNSYLEDVVETKIGKFEGEWEIFNSFPEISKQVTDLANKISGENQKGFKRVASFFSRGYNNDVLELAVKGARSVKSKMEIYKKALAQGGPDLAWEYIKASGENNYLNIEDGQIVKNSISRSTEFAGKTDTIIDTNSKNKE